MSHSSQRILRQNWYVRNRVVAGSDTREHLVELESTAPAALRRPGVTITRTKSGCFAKGGHSHSAWGHQDQHHRVQTRQAFSDGLVPGGMGNTGTPELRRTAILSIRSTSTACPRRGRRRDQQVNSWLGRPGDQGKGYKVDILILCFCRKPAWRHRPCTSARSNTRFSNSNNA